MDAGNEKFEGQILHSAKLRVPKHADFGIPISVSEPS